MNSRIALLPLAALVLAALGGCAVPAGSGLSPVAARTVLYGILDHTQSELGGTWQNQDDPTSRGCVFPIWAKGSHYPALRLGSAPRDARAAIRRTRALWSGLGYSLETSTVGSVTQLQGTNSLGRLLVLRVGSHSMTLQGESECRPVSSSA
jgi:hypothetical protein